MEKFEDRKREGGPPPDKYSVAIIIYERKEAQSLVRERGLDLVQTEVLEDGKRYRLTFYLNKKEIEELCECGYKLEVGENVSELGIRRQSEVGKGDRFDGGRIAPKGMGVVRDHKDRGPE